MALTSPVLAIDPDNVIVILSGATGTGPGAPYAVPPTRNGGAPSWIGFAVVGIGSGLSASVSVDVSLDGVNWIGFEGTALSVSGPSNLAAYGLVGRSQQEAVGIPWPSPVAFIRANVFSISGGGSVSVQVIPGG